jgi:hypothetical protein
MAKWAEKPWQINEDTNDIDAIFTRIKRVADIIKSDAVCKSRPTVKAKADELLALIDLLESKFDE